MCWGGPCPIDGGWADWSEWSTCPVESKDLGHGGPTEEIVPLCEQKKFRNRNCTNPTPMNGGSQCPADGGNQTTFCSTYPCPVDGSWSEWGEWASCPTLTCIHENNPQMTTRTKTCNNPEPTYWGNDCVPYPDGGADSIKECEYNSLPFCPIDGGWSEWAEFGSCSVTCGTGGTRTWKKACTNPAPDHGGQDCPGNVPEEQKECIGTWPICPSKSIYRMFTIQCNPLKGATSGTGKSGPNKGLALITDVIYVKAI